MRVSRSARPARGPAAQRRIERILLDASDSPFTQSERCELWSPRRPPGTFRRSKPAAGFLSCRSCEQVPRGIGRATRNGCAP